MLYENKIVNINSSKNKMKLMQAKKLQISGPKSIKLKFDNIKIEQESGSFSNKDSKVIEDISKQLDSAINNNEPPSFESLSNCLLVLKKLQRVIEQCQQPDSSKIKFRIVKSAKKNSHHLKKSDELEEVRRPTVLPFLQIPENKSQIIGGNKQNLGVFQDNKSSLVGKVKLKRLNDKNQREKIQNLQINQIKSVTNEQIINKIKSQLKRVSATCDEKTNEVLKLSRQVEFLTNQNRNLKQNVRQFTEKTNLKALKSQKNSIDSENIKLSLKFSQKCIQNTQDNQKISQLAHKKVQNNFFEKNNKKKDDDFLKNYKQTLFQQMQLLVVTQNKEIQILQNKLFERQPKLQKKGNASRWQEY